MARIDVTATELRVSLTRSEKVWGLLRDHTFPRSSITSASIADRGLAATPGLRAPGLGLPGLRKIGTWRGRGKTLVSVRRGQPALVVELAGERFDRLVIGAEDPQRLRDSLT